MVGRDGDEVGDREAGVRPEEEDLEWAFGTMGIQDKARHIVTLYLEDISHLVAAVDAHFGFSRYAEQLGRSASSFDDLYNELLKPYTYVDRILIQKLEYWLSSYTFDWVALSVPFPGNLYSALRCGEYIKKKYPQIKFVENNMYNEANNISSAYLVRNLIKNAYVLESDLYLYNPKLIRKYEYHSNFLGYYVDRSDDWCIEVKNGIITKEKVGGINCYQMVGISYYDENDGQSIEKDMEEVFNSPGGKEKYWEQVILDICKKNYNIYLRECQKEDIIEIDTLNELKAIDKTYDV